MHSETVLDYSGSKTVLIYTQCFLLLNTKLNTSSLPERHFIESKIYKDTLQQMFKIVSDCPPALTLQPSRNFQDHVCLEGDDHFPPHGQ